MCICSVLCLLCISLSVNQLGALAAQLPVQWDFAIRHTDGKSQELHPQMEQECHIPREMVCYQSKKQLILMQHNTSANANEVALPADQGIDEDLEITSHFAGPRSPTPRKEGNTFAGLSSRQPAQKH